MYSATVVKNIPNNDGFTLKYFLNKEELNFYRKTIENQWFYRLQILDPKIASFIYKNNITITNYHLIPNRIRIIVQLLVVASLVALVDQILKAFLPDASEQLSVFIGLIITNCIISNICCSSCCYK